MDKIKEFWEVGGPILVVLGLAGTVLTGTGVFQLLLSDTGEKVLEGTASNPTPFLLAIYALLITGIALIAIALDIYYRLKALEYDKDLRVIETLEKLSGGMTAGISTIYEQIPLFVEKGISIDKAKENAEGIMNHIKSLMDRLEKVLSKGYAPR
jgi:hypothetical protein